MAWIKRVQYQPPTSPDRLPSGRRNDVAARHHLVLQPRVSTVAVSRIHDEAETTCGIKGAIVRILNGHPLRAGGSRTARVYVASPSLCERDGIFRLACTAESAH